jgi:hypothetical protein
VRHRAYVGTVRQRPKKTDRDAPAGPLTRGASGALTWLVQRSVWRGNGVRGEACWKHIRESVQRTLYGFPRTLDAWGCTGATFRFEHGRHFRTAAWPPCASACRHGSAQGGRSCAQTAGVSVPLSERHPLLSVPPARQVESLMADETAEQALGAGAGSRRWADEKCALCSACRVLGGNEKLCAGNSSGTSRTNTQGIDTHEPPPSFLFLSPMSTPQRWPSPRTTPTTTRTSRRTGTASSAPGWGLRSPLRA